MAEQNFANHTKFFPPFHFFVLPVFIFNFGWSIYRLKAWNYSIDGIIAVVVAFALLLGFLTARVATLKVQDRVIRLEERLRLASLLGESLRPRIGEFTESQLIGLRFASDAELPALAARALSEKLSCAEIKKAVQQWRPDYWRV